MSADEAEAVFRVVQVRGGSLGAYVNAGVISVRYLSQETRFLKVGTTYLVGAGGSELFPTLESKVRAKKELFAGDAVVGIDESDKPCPKIEDPVLTLMPNGQPVEAGVFSLLRNERGRLLQAFILPIVFVMILLVGLVLGKRVVLGSGRSSPAGSRVTTKKSQVPRKRQVVPPRKRPQK